MTLFRLAPLVTCVILTACATWPQVPVSDTAASAEWPALLPIEDIGEPSTDLERERANAALLARAAGLQSRAALLRRPIADGDEMERLRQSLIGR